VLPNGKSPQKIPSAGIKQTRIDTDRFQIAITKQAGINSGLPPRTQLESVAFRHTGYPFVTNKNIIMRPACKFKKNFGGSNKAATDDGTFCRCFYRQSRL
jgi:hypothetical protein